MKGKKHSIGAIQSKTVSTYLIKNTPMTSLDLLVLFVNISSGFGYGTLLERLLTVQNRVFTLGNLL